MPVAKTEKGNEYIYLHKGDKPPKKKYQLSYDDYKDIINKNFKKTEKQSVLTKLEKAYFDNVKPEQIYDERLRNVYQEVIDNEDKRQVFEEYEDILYPVCIPKRLNVFFISGSCGAGKSTMALKIANDYKKANKKNDVYVISRLEEDSTLDQAKYIIKLDCDTFLDEKPTFDLFKNCLIIFDDFESYQTTNKHIYEAIIGLQNELLTMGRHNGISMIVINHLISNYKSTRLLFAEATHFILYPASCSNHSMQYLLGKYGGLDLKQIKTLKKEHSHFICLYRHHPNFLISDHKAELTHS
ncbi:MAG: ATP-binding protein [Candidatus Babeliales bacterium]|nr:ATP-binding protein [Candidatus Babeliales bacterium]